MADIVMSNIVPNVIDPAKTPPPGVITPEIDPDEDDLVQPDDIREPDGDVIPIEPDPEEGRRDLPDIKRTAPAARGEGSRSA